MPGPAIIAKNAGGRLPSVKALVTIVLDITTRSSCCAIPGCSTASSAASTQCSTSSCVVARLACATTAPCCRTTASVKVPPTSIPNSIASSLLHSNKSANAYSLNLCYINFYPAYYGHSILIILYHVAPCHANKIPYYNYMLSQHTPKADICRQKKRRKLRCLRLVIIVHPVG